MARRDPHEKMFRVAPAQGDGTLAQALREWLPGQSWSQVRQLVEARRLTINGNLCVDPARRLRAEDVVKLLPEPLPPPPRSENLRVAHADTMVAVVDKPAGLTSVRHKEERRWPARRKQRQPTLEELLPAALAARERRGGGALPAVRAVHRLDRDTSGLMVFARNDQAERHLGQQFRKHTMHRRYQALVVGRLESCTIVSHLARDRGDGRRGSAPLPRLGKRAVTHVRPIEFLPGFTLVECRLETGRTHQIRIHLSELGHPVCGDKQYNHALGARPIPDRSGARRHALHAMELGFVHPATEQLLRFVAELPSDMASLLERLRAAPADADRSDPAALPAGMQVLPFGQPIEPDDGDGDDGFDEDEA